MITAERAYEKVKQSLINLSEIESKINKAIENKKFEITLHYQRENSDKIYKFLSEYFSPFGYSVSKNDLHSDCIVIKISWDIK